MQTTAATRLIQPFIILFIIIVGGVTGYMIIEKMSVLDSFFMTIVSITTVGYGDLQPLSENGKVFTMVLLIFSWVTFAFALTRITQFVVDGEINQYFKKRRLMKLINKMQNHVIICGYGRNGHEAAKVLKAHGLPYLVIEKNHASIIASDEEENHQLIFLEGDSTDDNVLIAAGVENARALICTLPVDADNLFIVLSARGLNPGLQIVSRASEHNSIVKLKKAGADNVLMPDRIGGCHMANLVSKPDVVEFINFLSGVEGGEGIHIDSIGFEQLPGDLKGKTLLEIMSWKRTGVICIGIKSATDKFVVNPPDDLILEQNMRIMVLGDRYQISRMKSHLETAVG